MACVCLHGVKNSNSWSSYTVGDGKETPCPDLGTDLNTPRRQERVRKRLYGTLAVVSSLSRRPEHTALTVSPTLS